METREEQGKDLPRNADEKIAQLRSQIKQNSECGVTHYNLAAALMGKEEFDEAEKELHDALDCSPNLAEAYVLLGGICLQKGDLEGCLQYNRHSIKARAGFSEGYGNIAFVLLQQITGEDEKADEDKLDEAIKNLQKAIVYNSRFIQAYATLGNAYYMKGLVEEGIKANLKALEIDPDFPVAHNNLAVGYLQTRDFDKALFHCDKAEALGYEVAPELKTELEPYR